MRNRRPLAAALAVLSLLSAGCGARLDAGVRQRAADALLNGGGGTAGTGAGGGAGPGLASGAAGPASVTGAQGAGPTLAAGRGASGGGARTAGAAGSGSAGGCTPSGTDVGLTRSSVLVGNVSTLTGPVPGLFEGAAEGTNAFAAYVNSQGGLCGRTMQVTVADDGLDCSGNQNATSNLIPKVFAFVGSFSLYDGCGAKVLSQHPDVPDVHRALDPSANAIATNFSVEPGALGYGTGPFAYFAKKYGAKMQKVGTLYPNVPSAAAQAQAMDAAGQSVGWKVIYERAVAATETDWTTDFVKMCSQGVQVFFTGAQNAANISTMLQDEKNANCPKLVNIIPVAYDQAVQEQLRGNPVAEGLEGWNEYSLFFNPDEAAKIPELALFQQWFKRIYPNKPLNLYAMLAWASGRLFQAAMNAAGGGATRAKLVAALNAIHTFDANGMIAPADPTSKRAGPTCYVLWQFSGGSFHRIDSPASGYRCDGTYHYGTG